MSLRSKSRGAFLVCPDCGSRRTCSLFSSLASPARSALLIVERERKITGVVSSIFPLFLLLLCPVKVLPPAQKFYPEIPLSTPLRNRIRLPATPSTLAVGANLRFDLSFILCRLCFALAQVVELMIPSIAGTCCTAAPLVVDCGRAGLYIVNLKWQIDSTYIIDIIYYYICV